MLEKAALGSRVLAYLVDSIVGGVLSLIPVLGGALNFAYFLLRDGIGEGQGVGKHLLGIRVVSYPDGRPISYRDSARRNLVFALPALLLLIPVLGRIMYGVVMALVWIMEICLVLRDPEGRRFGDRWAGTMVVRSRKQQSERKREERRETTSR